MARRTLSALALALLVALAAPAPRAQVESRGLIPFLPDLVIDPAHIMESVANGRNIYNQARDASSQLSAFRDNLRKLQSYSFRDVGPFVSAVDRTVASGQALSYSTRDLDGAFVRAYGDLRGLTPREAADNYVQRRLDGSLGALRALREQATQLAGSRADVARLQSQVRTATSAQQIAEAQASVQAYQTQETQMVRQMLMVQANQAANDQAQEAAKFAYSREQARALAVRNRQQVSQMGGRDYNGSIFNR
ncbi:hypothetical protein [Rubrivirga litoralis]|uniref:P-type conjugative transfer protein TrbJ n=1 Tax=Rubrivirga litoralis TaxID=3075598 RepID=A0ABU3BUH7_9BACT|nr:hypothetical protein [Rubrivirga sp. F394]MDT0632949.1 hypothetical protein [Rubrivirga sp. F394]